MRIGYIVSTLVLTFVLMYSYEANISFATSCCDAKEVSASEEPVVACEVCGKAVDSMGKPVEVKEDGKSIMLCCEGCANVYREKHSHKKKQESYREKYQRKEPQKPQRGESYY